jgi:hypothetical protein
MAGDSVRPAGNQVQDRLSHRAVHRERRREWPTTVRTATGSLYVGRSRRYIGHGLPLLLIRVAGAKSFSREAPASRCGLSPSVTATAPDDERRA